MKKQIFILTVLFFSAIFINSCDKTNSKKNSGIYQCPMQCEGEKTYNKTINCPICKMELKQIDSNSKKIIDDNLISSASIFNLTSKWKTQNNETIELKDLKGDVLVMVMIYTSCKAACPRLVADMRNIFNKVGNSSVKYIFVSIDPETDTPKKLKEFAIMNQMDNKQWVFLQGNIDDVREFSNVLSVKYKQISPIDFSHSNIISVFNKDGVLIHQQEGLGLNNDNTVFQINNLIK
ncbi:MAG: SCO family protein [Candidatus Marinimicrobia bacterium]|jgi:protein SCO1/2|nr:SCO family protein [Candidatus Neomarinimicrobiota bacterium]MBT3675037.1 SCO family protein [Candidatus Neomarinimicrobiota bacterium]MBT3762728.1 SCO family protein [Candidatus Neomarinimicrobiota bacterium]MBT4068739.1 SCO family protein [Candidatus Neomarinimicrobiota bacterium]MBT4271306.1 SCO family protein [Candidatus Neomarinimicrobiota bacterium]